MGEAEARCFGSFLLTPQIERSHPGHDDASQTIKTANGFVYAIRDYENCDEEPRLFHLDLPLTREYILVLLAGWKLVAVS